MHPGLNLLDAVSTAENKFSNAEWAREVLGISEAQQIVMITNKSGDALLTAWGFHRLLGGFFIIDSFDLEIFTDPVWTRTGIGSNAAGSN